MKHTMNTARLFGTRFYRSALMAGLCLLFSAVCSAKLGNSTTGADNTEETFVFAGTCFNGEPYRLFLYQKSLSGVSQSHYDFEGPAGKGTVSSNAPPKVMAARVCRKFAEIISASYWE
jgi:hypothetical protein